MHKLHHSSVSVLSSSALESSFWAALQEPAALQEEVLLDILQHAAHTEIGRRLGFAGIASPGDYARLVPLSVWADYEPYVQRMATGESDLLFPGRAAQFLQTSGSTGQNKLVPQSAAGAALGQAVTRLRSRLRRAAVAAQAPGSSSPPPPGKVLLLSASGRLAATQGGIPVGYASGVTASQAPAELKSMHACPAWVYALPDPDQRDFWLLHYALARQDLVAAMGNNPRRFLGLLEKAPHLGPQLIQSIHAGSSGPLPDAASPAERPRPNPARAQALARLLQQGHFAPRYYWPGFNMACFWLGGPMAPAISQLRPLLPAGTLFFDAGYGASELKINLPLGPGSPYAPPALFAGYYEFLPADGGPALPCHRLQDGQIYEIVLTTYSGLYRYRPGDLVRVQGFTRSTPNLAFYSRVAEAANLAGEKTPSPLLLAAAEAASQALGTPLHAFFLWPDAYAGRYHCYYEAEANPERWAAQFDEALQTLAVGYHRRRADGSLKPPAATRLPCGWEKGAFPSTALGSQDKTSLLLPSPLSWP